MGKFKKAVTLTERKKTIIPCQSWFQKFHQMERISETVRCREFGDDLLEEDSETGGKWEQHVKHKYQRNIAGVEPAEVIRPGHTLQIEIANYCRRQLDEGYRSVLDDDNESSGDQSEGENVLILDVNNDAEFPIGDDGGRSGIDQSAVSDNVSEAQCNAYQVDENSSLDTSFSTSSSLDDAVSDTLDAEREQLAAVFTDFPACINRMKLLTSIDDEHYGLLAIIHDGAWSPINCRSLNTRVRQWIADFTSECLHTFSTSSRPPCPSARWPSVCHANYNEKHTYLGFT